MAFCEIIFILTSLGMGPGPFGVGNFVGNDGLLWNHFYSHFIRNGARAFRSGKFCGERWPSVKSFLFVEHLISCLAGRSIHEFKPCGASSLNGIYFNKIKFFKPLPSYKSVNPLQCYYLQSWLTLCVVSWRSAPTRSRCGCCCRDWRRGQGSSSRWGTPIRLAVNSY